MKNIVFLVVFLTSLSALGQTSQPKVAGNRWVFSGNVALQFSGTQTLVGASPTAGYRLTERLTAGAGYMYYYYSFRSPGISYSTSIHGPQAYARFSLFDGLLQEGDRLFIQSDYYYVSSQYFDPFRDTLVRGWIPQWYVGGGYYANLGGRLYAGLSVMFDLIDDPNAAFPNPMIGGGISIGL